MPEKTQQQDISNKTVLENPVLCCQFLKDNIDIPILKNLQPEDIEDCTELFRSYFGVEYEADAVKRVHIRETGAANWTATLHLKDRIFMNELFAKYIPDFTYCLVNLNDISNQELLERKDEMSLIMLVNKIQNAADLSEFLALPEEQVTAMIKESPEALVDIIAMCIQVLCARMNLSAEDTENCVKKVRSKSMGYMWENMEKIDVQAMQRDVKVVQRELREAKEELRIAKKAAEQKLQETKKAAEQELQVTKQAAQTEIERLKALLSAHGISQE